jgi:tetratricopeptide (TPR) repeat protein
MQRDPVLNKALNLTRRGKYDEAIKTLETEVVRYQDSFPYYHILGLACLYAGDFGGAFTYFNRAKNIKYRETGPLLGLALFFLKRGDTEKAVDIYLDVQDIDEKNRIAKRALAIIRRSGGGEELAVRIESGKARSLYPPIPGGRQLWKRLLFSFAVFLCAVLAAAAVFRFVKNAPRLHQRPGLEPTALTAEEIAAPMETAGEYQDVLTRDKAIALYDEARKAFTSYHDEKAKYYLNRLLESNASAAIKNKARLLKNYTAVPGFETIRDRFSYAEVAASPLLYRDCYVIWKGMAANPALNGEGTRFDLLVGYAPLHSRHEMEGKVAVEVGFPHQEINPAHPLEVLGKIVIQSGAGTPQFRLEAAGINWNPDW